MSSNTNIREIKEIISPTSLLEIKPCAEDVDFINVSRDTIRRILRGSDKRLLIIVGPCSIHDYDAALEYASSLQRNYKNIFLVMRVYFEKPRSRTGWKGLIYDPDLNDTYNINKGLTLARKLLLELTRMRIPIGCEFLDTITPQYLSDLVSWGAIGARTSESQIHRQLASGLSMPIGFKNLTSGDYEKAIDGIVSASYSHNFLGVDEKGIVSQVITKGNCDGHLILRGGTHTNYQQHIIEKIAKKLQDEKVTTGIIVDCSHGNSQKEYNRQILVALYVKRLRFLGYPINGIMLESNIQKGCQKISQQMKKGVSITDACIDIETTLQLLQILDETVVYYPKTLIEIRTLIREYDISISNGTLLNKSVMTSYMFEYDAELAAACKGLEKEEILLMNISMRLALSEKVAQLKFQANPFKFLLKSNDLLSLVTDREVERDNLHTFNNPLYLKIMEISKNLQVDFLEKYISKIRIGYLFGMGSFSHEAVQNFRGTHISYDYIGELQMNLGNGFIDYMLVPTYNSIIGDIELGDRPTTMKGSVEHKIELNLYSNENTLESINTLYIEPHIQREAAKYIKTLKYSNIEVVKSTIEGCRKLLQHWSHDITIASAKNESNFLFTLDRNIVEHNTTTFSLF